MKPIAARSGDTLVFAGGLFSILFFKKRNNFKKHFIYLKKNIKIGRREKRDNGPTPSGQKCLLRTPSGIFPYYFRHLNNEKQEIIFTEQ